MNVLVTGGAGFIGSQIADACVEAGHNVTILDNLSTGNRENINPAATFVEGDIRDSDLVHDLFRTGGFNLVNHHAAQLDVRVSVADPVYDAEQNILGSLNLLHAAGESGVERFIFASSGGTVYGDQEVYPADETHPTDPISPYGISKLSVEKYLLFFHHHYNLRHVIVRYTNVYGPRQNSHGEAGVVAIFCNRMLKGEQPVIYGTGEQTRDYVYVDDVVRANMKGIDYLDDHIRGTFNICTNTERSVNDLFRQLNHLLGDRFEEVHEAARPGEQFRSVCSWDKAGRELEWKPEVGFEEGLSRTLDFFRERFER